MDTLRGCHLEVTLCNTDGEYGITLSGGSDHNTPLYITKVKVDTPAFRCGLHKRDIIISINDYNCINCEHNTAVNLIKLHLNCVKFLVYRSVQPAYNMNSLFEEMKEYVFRKKLHLGQVISDDVEFKARLIRENDTPSSERQSPKNGIAPFSSNGSTPSPFTYGMKVGENTSSKISLTSFGSDWYKTYATSTVQAKKNVTVKDIMKLERSKSVQGRSYVRPSNGTNSDGLTTRKVKAIVERFNNQPEFVTNNIFRSPSKPTNGAQVKYETQYNGMDNVEPLTTDAFLQNPSKYLLSNGCASFQQNSVYEAIANDDYIGKGPCEISIIKGSKLVILRSIDSNWYEGFINYPDFKIIPKHIVAIDRIVFMNNGIDVEINRQLSTT